MAGLALAWLLADQRVTQIVVGPGRPEHLAPVREALERPLSGDERATLRACSVELGPDPQPRRRDRGAAAGRVRGRDGRGARRARPRRGADAAAVGGPVRGRGRVHGADARVARRRGADVRAQVAVPDARQPGARARHPPGHGDAVRRRDRRADGDPRRVRGDRGPDRGGERRRHPDARARGRARAGDPRGRASRAGRTWRRSSAVREFEDVRVYSPTACARASAGRGRRRARPSWWARPRRRSAEPTSWSSRRARGSRCSGATGSAPGAHVNAVGASMPERARARRRDGRGVRALLRQPRVAPQRGRRVPAGGASRARSRARTTSAASWARCSPGMAPGRRERRRADRVPLARARGRGSRRRRVRGRRGRGGWGSGRRSSCDRAVPRSKSARARIADVAVRTPLVRLRVEDAPAEIYLKLETLQPIGSFKIRGATNAVRTARPRTPGPRSRHRQRRQHGPGRRLGRRASSGCR